MELGHNMTRKAVREFLREQAKKMTKQSNGKSYYYVKSQSLLVKPINILKAKPTVLYDYSKEKRKGELI